MHTSSSRVALVLVPASLSFLVAASPEGKSLMVPMRDGTRLATTVYLPEGEGPWPCVLSRTPYNQAGMIFLAAPYTGNGYAFITQDCRGKLRSEGEYRPFRTDHHDGYDTVEWVARQEWSNGKVGMFGASALGITTNLAATQVPPHLVCGYVVVAPASARRNTVYQGGAYRKEMNDGWLKSQGVPEIGEEQVKHPPGESYWDWREIPDFHRRIRIPIYNVGGWFDIFAQGTIDNFVGLQSKGAGLAAGNQRLVMGPWAHGRLDGRLKFPDANAMAYMGPREHLRWFDRWLKGEKNGILEEPPVRYYVLGDTGDEAAPGNEWRTAPSWPPPCRPTSYFLHPKKRLSPDRPPEGDHRLSYDYDPGNPVPTRGGANLMRGGKGPDDQRRIPERGDYLRFQTEPLPRPLEVTGRIHVDLHVESDAPDTDFTAKLVDVYPDGYEALLCDGIVRARYREGIDKEVFLEKGQVAAVRIDLWSTAIVFNRGHRIALHLSSSNDPRFDPNPNTGKPLRSSAERRVARNTIHFSARHPSRLLLPVVKEYGGGKGDSNGASETTAKKETREDE
ncbi:MAG: CocE/NonD family hydrolase [Planctomycetota bacterium]|nr:CocE/NonD family hydrolase [Planctomycetota bacterium]